MGITKTDIYDRIHDRIELRDLEINQSLSEETLCYSATVVVDGEIACTAKNRGRGGKTSLTAYIETGEGKRDNRITGRHKNLDPLQEIADELPPVEGQLEEIEYDPEMIVDFVAGYQGLLDAAQQCEVVCLSSMQAGPGSADTADRGQTVPGASLLGASATAASG